MLWLKGRRPKEPEDWRAAVAEARADIAARARRGEKIGSDVFAGKEHWREHKVAFSRAQHGKCGYCELPISADPTGGDVDHYRPKSALTRLLDDPETWGDEVAGHNSRDPKKKRQTEHIGSGYHWLAYRWRNYLLACGVCNQKWKGNLFPVAGGHSRSPDRKSTKAERPLLLNPFGSEDPAAHLSFSRAGLIAPFEDSPMGSETIRTCHLARETLRGARAEVAKRADLCIRGLINELSADEPDEARLARNLKQLLRLGRLKASHAGMVRIMASHAIGFSWPDLRRLGGSLESQQTTR